MVRRSHVGSTIYYASETSNQKLSLRKSAYIKGLIWFPRRLRAVGACVNAGSTVHNLCGFGEAFCQPGGVQSTLVHLNPSLYQVRLWTVSSWRGACEGLQGSGSCHCVGAGCGGMALTSFDTVEAVLC